MHEELNDLQRMNTEIEEENNQLRIKSEEIFDQVQNLEGQKEQLVEQIQALEAKDEKRELYIGGLEKQVRQLKEESDRLKVDSNQIDRDTYLQIRELERDLVHITEQNEILLKQI